MSTNFSSPLDTSATVKDILRRQANKYPRTPAPTPAFPEEKTPAAVSVMVPQQDGGVKPFKIKIDMGRFKIGSGTQTPEAAPAAPVIDEGSAPLYPGTDAPSAPGQAAAPTPTQPPRSPGPVDQVQQAYENLKHAQDDPAKPESRIRSMLESLFAGMSEVGQQPIRDKYDLARSLSHIAATGVGGLVDKKMGSRLTRPYRVAEATEKLKQAQSVATTESTIEKRQSDQAATDERLRLQREREKRLTAAHQDVNGDRAKKNILAEYRARQEYDPEDPGEANDPKSLTNRAGELGMNLGVKTKDKKTEPEFSSGGFRYRVDPQGTAHVITDDKGEPVKDVEFDLKIKERKARIAHIGVMESIAQRREARLAQAQKDNRLDKQAKAEADGSAAREYEGLANDLQSKADAADDPAMKKLYTSQAEAARLKATGLKGTSGAQSVDARMRGMGSDKEFRQFFVDAYKQAHGGAEPPANEVSDAVTRWKSRYKK